MTFNVNFSVVRTTEAQYLSKSTSKWEYFYLVIKSKKYRSFLSTFKVKSKSTVTHKSTLSLTCCKSTHIHKPLIHEVLVMYIQAQTSDLNLTAITVFS